MDGEVYWGAEFKYKWQYNLWYNLSLFTLRFGVYPGFNKKWAKREMAWFVLESLKERFKR